MAYEFLSLPDEAAYKAHFIATYCKQPLISIHGFPVHFSPAAFPHAFYESSKRDGVKDLFSEARSTRMDWIGETLRDPNADWFEGWNARQRAYDANQPVCVAYGDFAVVVRIATRRDGKLKANYVTSYWADNSIGKIRSSPVWIMP